MDRNARVSAIHRSAVPYMLVSLAGV
jgi:hypothetical protein